MYYRTKVIVCEGENSETGVRALKAAGFEATGCENDGVKVCEKIKEEKPDVVIMRVYMPGMDAISVMKRIKESGEKKPMYIVTADYDSPTVNRELMKNGAGYILIKPFEYKEAAERIAGLMSPEEEEKKEEDKTKEVTGVLHSLGVPAHIKGYKYVRDAILLTLEDERMIESVTKRLYPRIGQINETTGERVERAIRHAIEIAWNRGDIDTLNEYFGSTIEKGRGKPTNSEFIAMIADKMKLKQSERSGGSPLAFFG